MRPIDADTLYDKAETWYKGAPTPYRKIYRSFVDIIADAPTITPPPNDPLTLEELRGMDGDKIYVHYIDGFYSDEEEAEAALKKRAAGEIDTR